MEYDRYLELISERAVGRYDVTALFSESDIFHEVVGDYVEHLGEVTVDAVAGIEALGLVFGTAIALDREVGLHPIRKGGKLPIPDDDRIQGSVTDYSGEEKRLELNAHRLPSEARVLIVDDWMETGAQMEVATTLIERAGGTVAGIAVLDMNETERIRGLADEYDLHTVNPESTV